MGLSWARRYYFVLGVLAMAFGATPVAFSEPPAPTARATMSDEPVSGGSALQSPEGPVTESHEIARQCLLELRRVEKQAQLTDSDFEKAAVAVKIALRAGDDAALRALLAFDSSPSSGRALTSEALASETVSFARAAVQTFEALLSRSADGRSPAAGATSSQYSVLLRPGAHLKDDVQKLPESMRMASPRETYFRYRDVAVLAGSRCAGTPLQSYCAEKTAKGVVVYFLPLDLRLPGR